MGDMGLAGNALFGPWGGVTWAQLRYAGDGGNPEGVIKEVMMFWPFAEARLSRKGFLKKVRLQRKCSIKLAFLHLGYRRNLDKNCYR